MKFFISTDSASFREVDDNPARMYLYSSDQDLSIALSDAGPVDIWIAAGIEITENLMEQWLGATTDHAKSLLVKDASTVPRLRTYAGAHAVAIEAFPSQTDEFTVACAELALRAAELLYIRGKVRSEAQSLGKVAHDSTETTVMLVGAGIVNLLTAEYLASRGLRVHVIDRSPDPRSCTDWTQLGATTGGGNARMFTYTEADIYNDTGSDSEVYGDMHSIFNKTASNGGWSLKKPEGFDAAELDWVEAFNRLPPWLARKFKEDMYGVNREAGRLWDDLIERHQDLFEDCTFRKDILRVYAEESALKAALELHSAYNMLVSKDSSEGVLSAHPELRTAAESEHLAGGFFVRGFTVNIHPFYAKLMDRITALGGMFSFDCDVQQIRRDTSGKVTSLQSSLGLLEADHYVLSPGVSGNALLKGTASENMIQGVIGVWLQLPNTDGRLQQSMKIHRRGHLVEDINVTVATDAKDGTDVLMLGGGYGYVGLGSVSPNSPELASLFAELEQVAQIYFPEPYAVAKADHSLWPGGQRKYCVRPFTATGLGLFERLPTATGGQLIIVGGNNTGGFAQGPAIAQAVWRSIMGEDDPIHALFHPSRGMLPRLPVERLRTVARPVEACIAKCAGPKLLLLCSDGPQHAYLRARLSQTFPGFRCIVETNDGQMRHLAAKGRYTEARYMRYHQFRRSVLGYASERRRYFDRLMPERSPLEAPDLVVDSLNCQEVWHAVEQWQPELTIVSGTKYIGRKLNERAGLMLNLHMGHLPEYKGNHCIFFAIYDCAADKVAATLHQLTPQLDGGNILEVVRPTVLPSDSEDMMYSRCLHMAIDRSAELAQRYFTEGKLESSPQKGEGQMFRHCDRTPTKELWLWWSQSVRLLRAWLARTETA